MIPQKNQNITIIFKNSIQIDGVVIDWSPNSAILNTLQGTSTIVIPNPNQEILFYKLTDAKQEYQRTVEKPNKSTQDLHRIAVLKNELNNIEKREIRERITQPHYPLPAQVENLNYGPLPFSAFKIPEQYSSAQASKPNTTVGTSLQRMFTKKH